MTNDSRTAVTLLGLGSMGTALATAFIHSGHSVTVWNRTQAKAEPLAELGAARAATAAAAVRSSDLVIACLLDYDSVHQVLDPVAGDLAGRTLVNLTNGTPRQAREMADWAAARDIGYLDGGIMAVPPGIGTDQAFVLYSGSRATFDRYEDTFAVLGTAKFTGTDPGRAALYDLSLLTGMYGMLAGVLQAFAMVRPDGVDVVEFGGLLQSWITAVAGSIPNYARQIQARDYTIGVVSNLGMQTTAISGFVQAVEDQGLTVNLLAPLQSLMTQRTADGYGAEDLSGLVDLLRPGA